VTDEEWEQRRKRVILAAFQTGRPVFAGSDGALHYADGDHEQLAADVGVTKEPIPQATALAIRARRVSRWAFVTSSIAAAANVGVGFWHPWQFGVAAVCGFSAAVWYRVNQRQRAASRGADARDRGAAR
jgi:hypothetical protein